MKNKKISKYINLLILISSFSLSLVSLCNINLNKAKQYSITSKKDNLRLASKNIKTVFNNSISIPASTIISADTIQGNLLCTLDDSATPKTCIIDGIDTKSELFTAKNPSLNASFIYDNVPYKLISINRNAFSNSNLIGNLYLPNSLSSIGNNAFSTCYGLKEVKLPETITSLDRNVFSNCVNLININLSHLIEIGNFAFSSCLNLSNLHFGEQLNKIGDGAFNGCPINSIKLDPTNSNFSLLSTNNNKGHILVPGPYRDWDSTNFVSGMVYGEIDLPQYNVSSIDDRFSNCAGLKSIILPTQITTINQEAFISCTSLESINLGNIDQINARAFEYCFKLKQINLKKVNSIGSGAFSYCYSLNGISLDNINLIDANAFAECKSLKTINFGKKLATIGSYAFYLCGLTSISLPKSLSSIGKYAFSDCPIQQVNFEGNDTYKWANNVGQGHLLSTSDEWDYQTSPVGCLAYGDIDISSSQIIDLKYKLFSYCAGITSCSIPSCITILDSDVFWNCYNLKQIYLNWTKDQIENNEIIFLFDEDEDNNWLGDLYFKEIKINIPKGTKSTYEKNKFYLGIERCKIVEDEQLSNNLSLILGLSLGLGIPAAVGVTTGIVLGIKKHNSKLKKKFKK